MDTIRQLIEKENQRHSRCSGFLIQYAAEIEAIRTELLTLYIEPTTFHTNGDTLDICFTGTFTVFKAFWKALRARGYRPSCLMDDTRVPSFCTFFYSRNDNGEDISVPLWVYWTSSVCRRVQTGTELKEVPVYEIRCSEDTHEQA